MHDNPGPCACLTHYHSHPAVASGLSLTTPGARPTCNRAHPLPHPQAVLASGTTLISVGHRPTLVRYHRRVLQLGPPQGPTIGATWSISSAEEFAGAAAAAAVGA
jgi:hypothetical protein